MKLENIFTALDKALGSVNSDRDYYYDLYTKERSKNVQLQKQFEECQAELTKLKEAIKQFTGEEIGSNGSSEEDF